MDTTKPTTEQASRYDNLEQKSVAELLRDMNTEDKSVPAAIEQALPQIEQFVNATVAKM